MRKRETRRCELSIDKQKTAVDRRYDAAMRNTDGDWRKFASGTATSRCYSAAAVRETSAASTTSVAGEGNEERGNRSPGGGSKQGQAYPSTSSSSLPSPTSPSPPAITADSPARFAVDVLENKLAALLVHDSSKVDTRKYLGIAVDVV